MTVCYIDHYAYNRNALFIGYRFQIKTLIIDKYRNYKNRIKQIAFIDEARA